MNTDRLLVVLRDAEIWLRREYGIAALWVFGPAAQSASDPIREVDLLIEAAQPLDVAGFIALRRRLEAQLDGLKVEPVLRPVAWPEGMDDVTVEARRVF